MPAMRIFRLLRDFDKPTVHQRAAHPAGSAGAGNKLQQAATHGSENQRRSGSGH